MKRSSKYLKLMGRPVVVDANVLFDLREIDSLYLLNEVFSEIIIPQDTIEMELDPETHECLENIKYRSAFITSTGGYEAYSACHARATLSHCDKMAIALAVENSFLLCTNEGPARKQAATLKISLTGTLGIIAAAYLNDIIDQAETKRIFRYLLNEGSCYIAPSLFQKVLSDLEIIL